MPDTEPQLLGATQIRELAARLGVRPTKTLGQNFVIDANTVRRIVKASGVGPADVVLEVGPGLGSLTLALLGVARSVVAVEIDAVLAAALPATVAAQQHGRDDVAVQQHGRDDVAVQQHGRDDDAAGAPLTDRLTVVNADALRLTTLPDPQPTALVANLPYNVAVPVLLTALAAFPSLRRGLVMVQAEVADRLAAAPGDKVYGVPSVKGAWYADVRRAGPVPRSVFWPVPNVDSGLVAFTRREPPSTSATREQVFACVDAAFAQRRKTLRAALAGWAGSPAAAEAALRAAGIDPSARGETLTVVQFAALAAARG